MNPYSTTSIHFVKLITRKRSQRLWAWCLGLLVSSFAGPTWADGLPACDSATLSNLQPLQVELQSARAKADEGAHVQAALELELLINKLPTPSSQQCAELRQLAVDLYFSYAVAQALMAQGALAEQVLQQLLDGDLTLGHPLDEGELQRVLLFARRAQLALRVPDAYLHDSTGQDLAASSMVGEPNFARLQSMAQKAGGSWTGLLAARYGRETNINFAPNSSLLNLFSDLGLIQVDLGETFRRQSGMAWLLDASANHKGLRIAGHPLEWGVYARRREAGFATANTNAEGIYASLLDWLPRNGGNTGSLDRLTVSAEFKTLFGQRVHTRELAYELPWQGNGYTIEPQLAYRWVDYSLSVNNARQTRLAATLLPQGVSEWTWGESAVLFRPGVRIEHVQDRAESALRLGGHQVENTVSTFVQFRKADWTGELALNSGRRTSEREYSALLQPGATLLVERLGWSVALRKALAPAVQGVVNFQKDLQQSNISVLETKNTSIYMGLEWRY